ncbi:DUF5677 domain-containing protein [Evansella sp. LMS18]|uniref:DUF5677 domain-containing protein n=1 Tax=Evansella sp. LMS18 TaxID=2924033 RepID=UPI0020D125CA|nr:DUF5677 domain-containing protein [Evansella sp. LMS18]UTR11059.1 DUF5677 domain-containing protein [Evansella sp. LMS18]
MKLLKKTLKESNSALEKILNNHFNKKNKELNISDVVTLALFEDMVEKIESLIVLIELKKNASMDTISRSILENRVYLKLLLSKDNVIYSRSYFAAKKIDDLKMYYKITTPGKLGNNIRELLGNPSIESIKEASNYDSYEVEVQKLKRDFEDVFRLREVKHAWYNLDGKTSTLEQLCNKKNIDMHAEYELMYRLLSKEVHAKDALSRWRFKENEVSVVIANKQDFDMHISLANTFLIETLDSLYSFYNMDRELKKFRTLLALTANYSKYK